MDWIKLTGKCLSPPEAVKVERKRKLVGGEWRRGEEDEEEEEEEEDECVSALWREWS